MIHTEIIEPTDHAKEWQAYVENSAAASLYHRREWQEILARSFGHRAHIVVAREYGTVRGVLPLVEMRSPIFGHFLVSLPFVNYGGIIADAPQYESALATAVVCLATRCGARHIELRQRGSTAALAEGGWRLRTHKSSLVVPLGAGADKLWASLSSRLRGKVRKAEKSDATFSICGREAVGEFYRLYSLNMRNLGTPVYTSAFFCNVLFQANSALLIVRRQGEPVAAALALIRPGRIELPWICSDYAHSAWHVNEFLYWKALEWASKLGAAHLDLGRSSTDSGPYRFKLQWNPEIQPLYWYYWLAPGAPLPELNPDNPKYALAVRCWKRLPLAVANRLGPLIVRNIP